ncbi:WHG domain-containing protein [Bacillus spongiae]|uniref:WHG domain-containing protein n=1 Tax=Bacillus spongiae TaxID=2683610 RepID=A0ABU8HBI6_9BACI
MASRIGLNQEIIMNKALEIAEKSGMNAVTMATIAKELIIKPPSLYNHFNGLKEIKQLMAAHSLKRLYHQLKDATSEKEKGMESIQAISTAYIAFANQYPGLYEASLSAPDPFDKNLQLYGEAIVDLTKEAFSVFSLNERQVIHTVRGLRSILHGLVDLNRKGEFNLDVALEESLEVIIVTFLQGLSHGEQLDG